MIVYVKPVVEIEYFNLDSEFAGGCGVIPQNIKDDYDEQFTFFEETEEENILHEIYGYNVGDGGYDDEEGFKRFKEDKGSVPYMSAVDNYVMDLITQGGADNLTSGFCYFTYNAAKGKTYS